MSPPPARVAAVPLNAVLAASEPVPSPFIDDAECFVPSGKRVRLLVGLTFRRLGREPITVRTWRHGRALFQAGLPLGALRVRYASGAGGWFPADSLRVAIAWLTAPGVSTVSLPAVVARGKTVVFRGLPYRDACPFRLNGTTSTVADLTPNPELVATPPTRGEARERTDRLTVLTEPAADLADLRGRVHALRQAQQVVARWWVEQPTLQAVLPQVLARRALREHDWFNGPGVPLRGVVEAAPPTWSPFIDQTPIFLDGALAWLVRVNLTPPAGADGGSPEAWTWELARAQIQAGARLARVAVWEAGHLAVADLGRVAVPAGYLALAPLTDAELPGTPVARVPSWGDPVTGYRAAAIAAYGATLPGAPRPGVTVLVPSEHGLDAWYDFDVQCAVRVAGPDALAALRQRVGDLETALAAVTAWWTARPTLATALAQQAQGGKT